MDFNFPDDKMTASVGEKDKNVPSSEDIFMDEKLQAQGSHSPTKLIDISDLVQQHKSDGSTDDFEHLYHDDPFATPNKKNASADENKNANGASNVMEDFLGTTKVQDIKNDAFMASSDLMQDIESNMDKKINQTMDFMAAERGGNLGGNMPNERIGAMSVPPPPPPQKSVQQPAKQFDDVMSDYHKEHYNPSPIKNLLKDDADEKFISSEDLLNDFKDEQPIKNPEPSIASVTEPKIETISKQSKTSDVVTAPADVQITKDEPIKSSDPVPKMKKSSEEIESKSSKKMISAEEIFYKFGLDTWFKPQCLHPKVESLIYWRDVKKSGIVFGAGLLTLLAISCFSVISVFAYLSILILLGTITFRIYKSVMGAVQKTSEGHPFKEYLEMDLNLPHDKVQQIVNVSVAHINGFATELRRLFLVEDLVDSIKFGVILWVLTYIGAWFNGMTLVILAFVALFTLPKVYENNKQSIDLYIDLVRSKILEVTEKVKAAVPIGKKQETDKDK